MRDVSYTPERERENARGCSAVLDQVADVFSVQREPCGRFFINDVGAFWKDEDRRPQQFVQWDFGGEELPQVKQLTYSELKAQCAAKRADMQLKRRELQ